MQFSTEGGRSPVKRKELQAGFATWFKKEIGDVLGRDTGLTSDIWEATFKEKAVVRAVCDYAASTKAERNRVVRSIIMPEYLEPTKPDYPGIIMSQNCGRCRTDHISAMCVGYTNR
jgi:hypothetical protein